MSNLQYIPADGLKSAVEMAILMEIPLFITGEPGTGKTELARWVAANEAYQKDFGISGEVLQFNVKTTSQAKDLLYRYDAIRHFRDSHRHHHPDSPSLAMGEKLNPAPGEGGSPGQTSIEGNTPHPAHAYKGAERAEVNVLNYIHFEPLGQAIIAARSQRRVVLIDEVDKAPRDFPNDLLFEFDKLGFRIEETTPDDLADPDFDWSKMPSLRGLSAKKPTFDEQDFIYYTDKDDRRRSRPERKVKKPFLILTSNSEKNLPDAFLRRCAFYHIPFPEDKDTLLNILKIKGLFDAKKNRELVQGAVEFFLNLRKSAGLRRKPATAELIAWVEFLHQLGINPTKPLTESERKKMLPSLSLLLKNKEDVESGERQLKKKE